MTLIKMTPGWTSPRINSANAAKQARNRRDSQQTPSWNLPFLIAVIIRLSKTQRNKNFIKNGVRVQDYKTNPQPPVTKACPLGLMETLVGARLECPVMVTHPGCLHRWPPLKL